MEVDKSQPPPLEPSSPAKGSAGKSSRRSFRLLGRTLAAARLPMWVLDQRQELVFVSEEAADWFGVAAADLMGQPCRAGLADRGPRARLLAALALPLGLLPGGGRMVTVEIPGRPPRQVLYLACGESQRPCYLAVADIRAPDSPAADAAELTEAIELRQRLSALRHWASDAAHRVALGRSAAAQRLRGQITVAAATDQHLALRGPRGSGAERLARLVHESAGRRVDRADPLVVVDTPLMDDELLAATLSPAAAHLEAAESRRVTLVLRCVDESPLDIQQQIVRFVQRVAGRVGGEAAGPVRLIGLMESADQQADGGNLAPALAALLSVLQVDIPPLSKRPEDIPLIASAMLDARHAAGQAVAQRIGRAALDLLIVYPWPDNFEELEAAIRHAASVCQQQVVGAEHLPLAVRGFRPPAARIRPLDGQTLDEALRRFERRQIEQALEVAGGNRAEAARLLGISRARLIRRLDEPG